MEAGATTGKRKKNLNLSKAKMHQFLESLNDQDMNVSMSLIRAQEKHKNLWLQAIRIFTLKCLSVNNIVFDVSFCFLIFYPQNMLGKIYITSIAIYFIHNY